MKTALITGASSGIGYELAMYHAQLGGNLVLVARSEHQLGLLKGKVEDQYGVKAIVIPLDLSVENAAKRLWDEVTTNGVRVDYLINNAGVGDNNDFAEAEIGKLQQMIQLNITSLMDFCHYFIQDRARNNKGGKILNVASTAAFQGVPYMSVYAASKAFVLSFTEGIAEELRDKNITATALCPGPTKTGFAVSSNMATRAANFPLLPSAKNVAKYGYDKMIKGETVAVHGFLNRMGVNSTRMFNRSVSAKVAGEIFKRTR